MSWRWAALCLVAAVAGCSGRESAEGPASGPYPALDCEYPLEWNGVRYHAGLDLPRSWTLGPELGPGVVLGCGDEETGYPDEDVAVHGIQGVPPLVAVAAELEGASRPIVWLGDGYLVQSPGHPLQRGYAESQGLIDFEREGFTCGSARTKTARAVSTPAPGEPLEVEADDAEVEALLTEQGVQRSVSLQADTAISGLERDGVPYIGEGDEFELVLRVCDGDEDEPGLAEIRLLVAESLTGSG